MLNARQTARDVTLPQINQNAAISGNSNSSRTGIAEGLVQRGLLNSRPPTSARPCAVRLTRTASRSHRPTPTRTTRTPSARSRAPRCTERAPRTQASTHRPLRSTTRPVCSTSRARAHWRTAGAAGEPRQPAGSVPERHVGALRRPQRLMGIIGSNNWGSSSSGTSTTTKTPSAFESAVMGGLLGTAAGGKKLFGF
jgi:hypothetical protein